MWKKVLLIACGVLVLAGLTVGTISAVTAADNQVPGSPPPPGGRPGGPGHFRTPGNSDMLNRVAQILNIDPKKLADAFKQAGTELGQKRLNDVFVKLVADGKLTQAQADQYKAWLNSRPSGVPGIGVGPVDSSRLTTLMDRLLKDGKITEAQYNAWKSWIAQKPNFDLPKPPQRPSGPLPRNRR